jgi:5-formyltetrahydrofolate cyclo-ligase
LVIRARNSSSSAQVKDTPATLKAGLRSELRAAGRRFSDEERAAASASIQARLGAQAIWERAQTILFYAPMAGEPDIYPLFLEALAAGKTAALPRFSPDDGHYEACQVQEASSQLRTAAFGVREPTSECLVLDLKRLDLVLVPGLGFSFNGYRLGRGKGYYDRLLAEISGFKCGVAFDWQVTVEIPVESHDIRLDCVLTPTRWLEMACERRP